MIKQRQFINQFVRQLLEKETNNYKRSTFTCI